MGILEKLRPSPRWRHADPAVRTAAIYDLGPDESEVLHALAREDGEARVRRAAVQRIDAAEVLADIIRTDPDEDVRLDAVRSLAGIAAEAADTARALAAVGHLLELGRLREVVVVARESAGADVRAAAVDGMTDQRGLGSIARKAADYATRMRALTRLTDADELLQVALRAEHTDVAVAALERTGGQEALTSVAQRARNKVAVRRARTMLRRLEEAIEPVRPGEIRMRADDRQRALDFVRQADGLVAVADPAAAAAGLAAVRLAWAELQADTEIDAALGQQFESASEAAREAIAQREAERAAEDARQRALAREQADRVAICDEILALTGPGAADRIAELKVRWDSLPPMPSEYAASLTRRFQDACREFGDRERRATLAAAASSRLETLATELEQLVQSSQAPDEIVARWRGLRRDADVLREHAATNPAAADRVERVVTLLEEQERQQSAARARQEQDNLKRLQQLCRQVETLAGAPTLTLKAADRALGDIRAALEGRQPLPSKQDRRDVQVRLEAVRAVLGPRAQELREADEWQRWANLQVQETLCRDMEALKAEANLELAARRMRELQGRWKQVALAPRAQGEAMWRRFKTAQDEVFARTEAHMAAQREALGANLARKLALCDQAEALADSSDWVRTATAMQALQAEWKTIGPVPRGHEKATWERFRGACDRFFTRRLDDLRQRKEQWTGNLSKKEALCAAAEALADSTDWEAAAGQIRKLQAEWKTVGAVRRSKSEAVWQRFREACDRFFDRYKHRDEIALAAMAAPREAIVTELEALLPAGPGDHPVPDGLADTVREARARWQQAADLPRHVLQPLAGRYQDALRRLVAAYPSGFGGTDLDPDLTRRRMEKLIATVEELAPAAGPAALSPTERLAQQLRERLASNTIAGRAAEDEDARWRAAEQDVRHAQAQWARLGPIATDVAAPLNDRFQRACRRFYDRRPRAS
jgi:hypothetical protein